MTVVVPCVAAFRSPRNHHSALAGCLDVDRTSKLSPLVIVGVLNPAACDARSMFARHRWHRVLSPGWTPYRARCAVCFNTSPLSSFVIDGFDTLPRSMCGFRLHVIAVTASYGRVPGPVATTIAVGNDHTDCPRIWPAIESNVWSVLTRNRYCRLSLTGSTRHRARCVVLVRTSSLSLDDIVRSPVLSLLLSPRAMFTPIVPGLGPRSHPMCGLCYHGIAIVACH